MLKIIDRLRPRTDSPSDLTTALHEAETALAKERARLAALEGERGEALMVGGKRARRHEAALADARAETERLTAVADALRQKLAEADRQERRARLERQVAQANRLAEAAGRAIAERYPQLAGELIALVEAERAALKAVMDATLALATAGELGQGIVPPAEPASYYCTEGVGLRLPLGDTLTLPDHRHGAGAPPLWPRLVG
jgi:chromosome segregation ATPase